MFSGGLIGTLALATVVCSVVFAGAILIGYIRDARRRR